MNCLCGKSALLLTVTKDSENKGKKFYACPDKKCNYFKWLNNYNPSKFQNGACYRCGRFGCYADDCNEVNDFYGNKIPDDWGKYN